MSNLTVKLVLNISPELDKSLDEAFERADRATLPTRTDYIRSVLSKQCEADVSRYRLSANRYVKDEILNKVVWVIISRYHLSLLPLPDCKPFTHLYLDEFMPFVREHIEEVFRGLKKQSCLDYEKNHKGNLVAFDFDFLKLLEVARTNIIMDTMQGFIDGIKKWNTGNGVSISDICRTWISGQMKTDMSNNGFIITANTKTHIPNEFFIRDIINDSPSEYARKLWDIPLHQSEKPITRLYVSFPDIYIGQI